MTEANQCFEAGCQRGALASVTRPDLPGPLRLCATHTEQFRQSSEGWVITWPAGAAAPTTVAAPSSDVLWAYKPSTAPPVAPIEDPERRGLTGWIGALRSGRRPPK